MSSRQPTTAITPLPYPLRHHCSVDGSVRRSENGLTPLLDVRYGYGTHLESAFYAASRNVHLVSMCFFGVLPLSENKRPMANGSLRHTLGSATRFQSLVIPSLQARFCSCRSRRGAPKRVVRPCHHSLLRTHVLINLFSSFESRYRFNFTWSRPGHLTLVVPQPGVPSSSQL